MPLSSLSDDDVDRIAVRTAHYNGNGNVAKAWSNRVSLTVSILVVSGMLISAGITISRVGTVEEQTRENRTSIVELQREIDAVKNQQSELRIQLSVMNEKLDAIRQQLVDLKAKADGGPSASFPHARVFDK